MLLDWYNYKSNEISTKMPMKFFSDIGKNDARVNMKIQEVKTILHKNKAESITIQDFRIY